MSTPPTDAELFALIKEHFGLDQRRDDTVINRSTGRFHDAQRYRDFAAAVLALAKWGQPAQAAEPVAWLDDGTAFAGSLRVITNETKEYMPKRLAQAYSIPLFAAPQPVAWEPLSHAQAKALVLKYGNDPLNLVFQVELAHGIKGGQHD